jgi:hypothetical protein
MGRLESPVFDSPVFDSPGDVIRNSVWKMLPGEMAGNLFQLLLRREFAVGSLL